MASNDIRDKLRELLDGIRVFKHEMEVMYFLVEVRKLIDLTEDGKKKYPLIKFYCDWAVHTKKDYAGGFAGLEKIFDEIYDDCKSYVEQMPHVSARLQKLSDFLYIKELQKQFIDFFREFYLDMYTIADKECWLSFTKLLAAILQDQPISNIPNSPIQEIAISFADERGAGLHVLFKQPIKDKQGNNRHWVQLLNGF